MLEITKANKDSILKDFFDYWKKKVDTMEQSPFDRMEELAVSIFYDWLSRRTK